MKRYSEYITDNHSLFLFFFYSRSAMVYFYTYIYISWGVFLWYLIKLIITVFFAFRMIAKSIHIV